MRNGAKSKRDRERELTRPSPSSRPQQPPSRKNERIPFSSPHPHPLTSSIHFWISIRGSSLSFLARRRCLNGSKLTSSFPSFPPPFSQHLRRQPSLLSLSRHGIHAIDVSTTHSLGWIVSLYLLAPRELFSSLETTTELTATSSSSLSSSPLPPSFSQISTVDVRSLRRTARLRMLRIHLLCKCCSSRRRRRSGPPPFPLLPLPSHADLPTCPSPPFTYRSRNCFRAPHLAAKTFGIQCFVLGRSFEERKELRVSSSSTFERSLW